MKYNTIYAFGENNETGIRSRQVPVWRGLISIVLSVIISEPDNYYGIDRILVCTGSGMYRLHCNISTPPPAVRPITHDVIHINKLHSLTREGASLTSLPKKKICPGFPYVWAQANTNQVIKLCYVMHKPFTNNITFSLACKQYISTDMYYIYIYIYICIYIYIYIYIY